jgi:hypothetical protein
LDDFIYDKMQMVPQRIVDFRDEKTGVIHGDGLRPQFRGLRGRTRRGYGHS